MAHAPDHKPIQAEGSSVDPRSSRSSVPRRVWKDCPMCEGDVEFEYKEGCETCTRYFSSMDKIDEVILEIGVQEWYAENGGRDPGAAGCGPWCEKVLAEMKKVMGL